MLDRTVNVRLPLDMLHRLESRVAKANALRAESKSAEAPSHLPGANLDPLTMSEAIRKTLKVGLDVMDGDTDAAEDFFMELFHEKLLAMLALPSRHPEAMKLLKKIAASAKVEPDFG